MFELSLFFLMYTEGSCMRHFPDGLLFFLWCGLHSPAAARAWDGTEDLKQVPVDGRERRIKLRNDAQVCDGVGHVD